VDAGLLEVASMDTQLPAQRFTHRSKRVRVAIDQERRTPLLALSTVLTVVALEECGQPVRRAEDDLSSP
jgi:hypothetical protein